MLEKYRTNYCNRMDLRTKRHCVNEWR